MRVIDRTDGDGVHAAAERNALLRALTPAEYDCLSTSLESVWLDAGDVLYEPEEAIKDVYFPINSVLSLLAMDDTPRAIEVGTIGNEGMSGLPIFHGMDGSPQKCLSQVPGYAKRLSADVFERELQALPAFRSLLHRYCQSFFNDVAQTVVCNQLHSIEQRCARWLLMTHDRVAGTRFTLTHQFLALMLGTRRSSVTVAAQMLRKRGLIRYTRGSIEVLDRDGLEHASCACYRITRSAYDHLLSNQ